MKVAILNTFDTQGGAAIATYRMHNGLRQIGVDANMLVQRKGSDSSNVFAPSSKLGKAYAATRPFVDNASVKKYKSRNNVLFSPACLPDNLSSRVKKINPDVVHLFWVNAGFFKIETLNKFKQPIVWTLHDMWPFTGGCHYDDNCGQFQQSCGNCPALNSNKEHDLSRQIWKRKQKAWSNVPIVVVATSNWLADMARVSSLFKNQRIEVIPNGIDIEKYKPANKEAARDVYNLPKNKKLILFSAFSATSDKRKGSQYLIQALNEIAPTYLGQETELVIVGASRPETPPDLGMKIHYMGNFQDEISQVLLYSAVDVLVAPSIQENLANTVMESLACATPVVAFNIGGMPDMIDHQKSGYLAEGFDYVDLANGIKWVLENQRRHVNLSKHARKTVMDRYTLAKIAHRYSVLYQSLLK